MGIRQKRQIKNHAKLTSYTVTHSEAWHLPLQVQCRKDMTTQWHTVTINISRQRSIKMSHYDILHHTPIALFKIRPVQVDFMVLRNCDWFLVEFKKIYPEVFFLKIRADIILTTLNEKTAY